MPTLKQKISQMFITGFYGTDFEENEYFEKLLETGLGGVIFFTHNIETAEGFESLIKKIGKRALYPLFYSIDQEGGRVERTENIHGGKKYLSAKYAFEKGEDFLKTQTRKIAEELKSYGINMNFAPVLDVNTNEKNPIIGERAFSSDVSDVKKGFKAVFDEYEKAGIITVGKHFPGHGAASADSHKTLPVIDISENELKKIHIEPFKYAVDNEIPAIMAAHVIYPVFDKENPSSVSKKIINDILIEELGFKGIIMTDDMEMNGIKGMSRFEACKRAINAGVSMFIFRDTDEDLLNLIEKIEKAVYKGEISLEKTDSAFEKILKIKCRYGIMQKGNN